MALTDDEISRKILLLVADLYKAKRPLTVTQIAKRNGLAWKTANGYVKFLEKAEWIVCTRTKRRTYCELQSDIRKSMDREMKRA